jgi:hypothetical protein
MPSEEDLAVDRMQREWGAVAERYRDNGGPGAGPLIKRILRLILALGLAGAALWCADIRPPRPAGVISAWGLMTGVSLAALVDGFRGGLIAALGLGLIALFWVILSDPLPPPWGVVMLIMDAVPLILILWLVSAAERSAPRWRSAFPHKPRWFRD